MEQTKFDVFISYSRKDYVDEKKNVIPGNEVSKIKKVLTDAGISFWIDEEGIVPGEDYAAKITKHIKICKIFVYISSEAANQSDWTRKEIACALLYKKCIIPLLLDDSPFHDSVILRIADLDRIDYYLNPNLGLEKLVRSIKTYLEELAVEKRRKEEEEERKKDIERKKAEELKLKKEQEEKLRLEEQQKIVKEITLKCTALNNEETKIELDRATLILSTEKVADEKERASLISLIQKSSPIQKKAQAENTNLKKANEEFKELIRSIKDERDRALASLNEKSSEIEFFLNKEKTLQSDIERLKDQLQKTNEAFTQLKTESKTTSLTVLAKLNKRLKIGISILALFSLFLSIIIILKGCESHETTEESYSISTLPVKADIPQFSSQEMSTDQQSIQQQQSDNSSIEVANETNILQAIDLGLSVKWANMNIGAKSSYQIGSYFAWGEVSPKKDYKKTTYEHLKNGKYALIGEKGNGENGHIFYNIGGTDYDAAHKNLGNGWRMPTESECRELMEKCDWTWDGSKSGYIVTGKKVKNSIFLPATGCMAGKGVSLLSSKVKNGFYWSSKTANTQQYSYGESASVLQFDPYSSNGIVVSPIDRVYGRCIRAVCE